MMTTTSVVVLANLTGFIGIVCGLVGGWLARGSYDKQRRQHNA